MVILEVHTKQIKVKYKSTLLSQATLLALVCAMFSIILPFVFAYKSGGFWLKRDVFHEQPRISLKGEYLLIATTNNITHPIICSTYSYYKERLDFLDVCSTIKLREIDDNLDGKVDKISLTIGVNLFDNKINSLNLVLPISYELTTVCPVTMQSAIVYQHWFPYSPATDLRVVGDLTLSQSSAIQCGKRTYDSYNYPVVGYDGSSYELGDVIERYSERNMSTHLTNVYTHVESGNQNKFTLKLLVRYPEHAVYYRPQFWQIMKWAWVQYFALYIIIAWFVRRIKNYIFNNRLVLFYEDSPIKKSN
ncbi:hypothetical protein NQ318_020242 [Aromia moschata]|uniref:Transmembrane protein 231 n=1 Tax=Aromia moschata TaxID=1265417 RepID=A0AAV8Z9U5_9CUCU|nr:hypothetical protein NQ318_020242 [Aromia moschata]